MRSVKEIKSILVICTGNICRSPTAEGVLRAALDKASLGYKVAVDSAGTHSYHVGQNPDPRSVATAKKHGYDIKNIVSRKFQFTDFYEFDLILAMDESHLRYLEKEFPNNSEAEIALFLEYGGLGKKDVPDPYYGSGDGFEKVLRMIEQASENIVKKLHALI